MKKVGILAFVTFLNLGLAFFSQLYIISVLGAGKDSDALFAGMALPQLLLTVLSGSLINVLVPLFVGTEKEKLKREIWGFIFIIGLIFGIISLFLVLTAGIWTSLIAPGFTGNSKDVLIHVTRIQLLGMVFTAISGILWAYNYSIKRFIITESSQFVAGCTGLICLYFFLPKYGIVGAAWIFTGKLFVQVAFLIPFLGFKFPNFKSDIFKIAWVRIRPLIGGSILYKTDPIIDRFLASLAPAGALSILYLSQQIYNAGTQILSKTLVVPTLPTLTELAKKKEWEQYKGLFWKKFYILLSVNLVLIVIGLSVFKFVIPNISIFQNKYDYDYFYQILLLSSLSFIIPSLGQLMGNSFYAVGETRKITKLGITAFLCGVPLKFVLFYFFNIKGLAFAISLSYLVSFVIMMIAINKKFKFNA